MTQSVKIDNESENRLTGLRSFLVTVMDKAGIDAILVPTRLSMKNRIMPMLLSDPELLSQADPFSPAFPINGAQQLAKLTRIPAGGRMIAILRPCEIRAFNELVKLNQGKREGVVIIGMDCPGAFSNTDFRIFADRYETLDDATFAFCDKASSGEFEDDELSLPSACMACSQITPGGADIAVEWFGTPPGDGMKALAQTDAGEKLLAALDLPPMETVSTQHKTTIDKISKQHSEYRKQAFADLAETTGDIEGLSTYLADCVNCYNCRVACPVCYCTTCVFTTDTFKHEPFQYLQWARRKGGVKMPTDTLFFHLTRMAHISCACVGCGQCSNACPNDIPVSDLFTYVAKNVQKAFGYGAGMDLSHPPPMSVFEKEEYEEIVGLT